MRNDRYGTVGAGCHSGTGKATYRRYLPFSFGTFAPFLRASESPIAIACFLLFTVPPLPPLPDLRVPLFSRCTALLTLLPAALPYFAIVFLYDIDDICGSIRRPTPWKRSRPWPRLPLGN